MPVAHRSIRERAGVLSHHADSYHVTRGSDARSVSVVRWLSRWRMRLSAFQERLAGLSWLSPVALATLVMAGCGGSASPRNQSARSSAATQAASASFFRLSYRIPIRTHRPSTDTRPVSCASAPNGFPAGDIAYCELGLLMAPSADGYQPPISAADAIAAFKHQSVVMGFVGEPALSRSHPIAALHRVTASFHNQTGVRAGTTFPAWLVQVEVPYDRSVGYSSGGPMGSHLRRVRHPSWIVCDAALLDLATRHWTGAWESECQGARLPKGTTSPPS